MQHLMSRLMSRYRVNMSSSSVSCHRCGRVYTSKIAYQAHRYRCGNVRLSSENRPVRKITLNDPAVIPSRVVKENLTITIRNNQIGDIEDQRIVVIQQSSTDPTGPM